MSPDDIFNERVKLFANWLNTLAGGVIITGAVAPLIAVTLGFTSAADVPVWAPALSSVIWLFSGVSLHLIARRSLRSLK